MAKVEVDLSDTIAAWREKTNELGTLVGDLTSLNTTQDSDLVGAINELKSNQVGFDSDIAANSSVLGTLSLLTTTDKTNLVAAVNEVNARVPNVYDDSDNLLNT